MGDRERTRSDEVRKEDLKKILEVYFFDFEDSKAKANNEALDCQPRNLLESLIFFVRIETCSIHVAYIG